MQKREWPFAGVSRCASGPVVKQALRVVCGGAERASCARSRVVLRVWRRRLPLHSLRRDLSGARHAPACPRQAVAAIAAPRSCCRVSVLCCSLASCPLPMGLTGRGLLLPARSYWQLGWRVTSGKFRSGILPQFQHQLRASLFCVVGRVTRSVAAAH